MSTFLKNLATSILGFSLIIIFFFLFEACSPSQDIQIKEWITTTEDQAWTENNSVQMENGNRQADVMVNIDSTYQTIEGFGGCFNELGWVSLSALNKNDRNIIFSELFEPGKGGNFNVCRMPLGANDFSLNWYSYNETEGDFEMEHFSIDNDLNTLIPYIKSALEFNPKLKIWASPWSPPSWMKWNKHYACAVPWDGLEEQYHNNLQENRQGKEGTNMFIQEEPYFKAYALYFSKFIEAYREQNIDIFMVMPQNEFNSCQIFPSCTWTSSGLATFIGKYLGPAMEKENVEIMFGTMERPAEALVDTVLNDQQAGNFIKGVGFQWAGKEAIPGINKRYPNMELYQTEQECGDGKNDWKFCTYAWSLMKHFLSNGTNVYLYWNMSLPEGGISRWGWSQNALVTVDTLKSTYQYNHEYYLMKHFSHYVMKGAKRVKTSSNSFNDILAFKNPDNSLVLVMFNQNKKTEELNIEIKEQLFNILLQPESINTIVMRDGL